MLDTKGSTRREIRERVGAKAQAVVEGGRCYFQTKMPSLSPRNLTYGSIIGSRKR